MVDSTATSSTRVNRFRYIPFTVKTASVTVSQSATVGFLSQASTRPVTIPALMVGFSVVKGDARNAAMIVGIFAPAAAVKTAARIEVGSTQARTSSFRPT